MGFLAGYLQYKLAARPVCKTPVYSRRTRVNVYNMDIGNSFFHFFKGRTSSKYPRYKLKVRYATSFQCLIINFIIPIVWKIKQPGRKPGLIHPFRNELFLFNGQSYIPVMGSEYHAVLSIRCK